MRCPKCGFVTIDSAKQCPQCAYWFIALPQVMPQNLAYKTCPACGQPSAPNMAVCGRCGFLFAGAPGLPGPALPAPLPPPYIQAQAAQSTVKVQRTLLVLGALFLLLLFIGVEIVVLRNGQSASAQRGNASAGSGAGSLVMVQTPGLKNSGSAGFVQLIDPNQINQRLFSAGAEMGGDLEVTLAWNSTSDLDIQLIGPSGEFINANHPTSASGGVQDVDANPTPLTLEGTERYHSGQIAGAENVIPLPDSYFDGHTDAAEREMLKQIFPLEGLDSVSRGSIFTHTPVEHIRFAHAPRGTYRVFVSCFCWREPNLTPLPFTIQIATHGQVFQQVNGYSGPDNVVASGVSSTEVCRFEVK